MGWFWSKEDKKAETTVVPELTTKGEQPAPVPKIKLNFRGLSKQQINDMANLTLINGGMQVGDIEAAEPAGADPGRTG